MSKSREQLNTWLKHIHLQGKTVLDIGCQDKPASDRINHKDCNFKTLDVDNKWGADYTLDIGKPIDKHTRLIGRFDVIFALELFEHVPDLYVMLSNIRKLLKTGGKVFFSYPFINPFHDFFDFARYTHEGMEKALSDLDFTGIHIDFRRATRGRDDLLAFYQKEGMRISKIRSDHDLIDVIGMMGLAIKK